jgi:hypothetical protein
MDQQEKVRFVTGLLRQHVDALLVSVRRANAIFPHRAADYVAESPAAAVWHNAFHRAAEEHDILRRTTALETRLLAVLQSLNEDVEPDGEKFVQAWLRVAEIGEELSALARWSDETRRKISQAVAALN